MREQRDMIEGQAAMLVDPVCGAPLLGGDAAVSLEHAGRTWHFCGLACRARFARRAEAAVLSEALRAGRLFSHRGRARWGAA